MDKAKPIAKWNTHPFDVCKWTKTIKTNYGEKELFNYSIKHSYKVENNWVESVININSNELSKLKVILEEAEKELYLSENKDKNRGED